VSAKLDTSSTNINAYSSSISCDTSILISQVCLIYFTKSLIKSETIIGELTQPCRVTTVHPNYLLRPPLIFTRLFYWPYIDLKISRTAPCIPYLCKQDHSLEWSHPSNVFFEVDIKNIESTFTYTPLLLNDSLQIEDIINSWVLLSKASMWFTISWWWWWTSDWTNEKMIDECIIELTNDG